MYKARANHEDRYAINVEKWEISPSTVRRYHESPSIIKEDPIGSQHPVIKEQSSVIWAQTTRRSRETDAASGHKVSGKG